jgi:hypothetical protein
MLLVGEPWPECLRRCVNVTHAWRTLVLGSASMARGGLHLWFRPMERAIGSGGRRMVQDFQNRSPRLVSNLSAPEYRKGGSGGWRNPLLRSAP